MISQPPMASQAKSITTGLLTLSVHDSLTFDGVEVALNPDLFASFALKNNSSSTATTTAAAAAQQSSSTVLIGNANTNGTHSRQHSRESIAAGINIHYPQQHGRDSNFGGSVQNPMTPSTTTHPFHRREASDFSSGNQSHDSMKSKTQGTMQPGDLIEIRVWEERKHPQNTQDATISTVREKMQPLRNRQINRLSANMQQQQHARAVIDGAASKLQQHVNQSSSAASIFHPLATMTNSSDTGGGGVADASSSSLHTNKKIPTKPPIPPRTTSNASSLVASPLHTAPTPSLSPSPSHNQGNITSKAPLLPRWNNTESDDVTVASNISNTEGTNIVNEKDKLKLPFPVLSTDKVPSGTSSNMHSPRNDSGTVTPIMNSSTYGLSPSFDYDESSSNNTYKTKNDDRQVLSLNTYAFEAQEAKIQQEQPHEEGIIELLSKTHFLKTKFVMSVTEQSLRALKSSGRTQISLLKNGKVFCSLKGYK